MKAIAYILNRVHTKRVNYTLYELWTERSLELSYTRPWGCTVYNHNSSIKLGQIGPRGKKIIFVVYSETYKRYVFIVE